MPVDPLDHLGLLRSIAWEYYRRKPSNCFWELDDYFQAGFFGLLKAAKNYDSSRGFPFTVDAARAIKGSIIKELIRADEMEPRDSVLSRLGMKRPNVCSMQLVIGTSEGSYTLEDILESDDNTIEDLLTKMDRQTLCRRIREHLPEWLAVLTKPQRSIIEEYVYGNVLYKDIAAREGVKPAAIYARAGRAYKLMRPLVEAAGFSCA